jgi:Na+-translocating ferredoxin:NAD+ oxidoreductase RnfD subunit
MMHVIKQIISSPVAYVGWSVIVVVALIAAYLADPYVFGFTTFILGALSAVVVLAGFWVANFSKQKSSRAMILFSLILTVAAIVISLKILSTFKWA